MLVVVDCGGMPFLRAKRSGAHSRNKPRTVPPCGFVLVGTAEQLPRHLLRTGGVVHIDLAGMQLRILGADHPHQSTQAALVEIGHVAGQHGLGGAGHDSQALKRAGIVAQFAGDANQMVGIVAAQQWRSLRCSAVGMTGIRLRDDHHAAESAGTQMLAELRRIRRVVGLQWPTHGGAVCGVARQGAGQPGGHRIVVGGGADQKPGSGVGLVCLGQFALPPFDGE